MTTVRVRGLDPAACDLLADRGVAAAARRELAGHLPCVQQLWRNNQHCNAGHMQLCWLVLVLRGHGLLIVMSKTQPSSIIVPGFICESVVACWHNQAREPPATSRCGCLASRFGQLDLHVENGLLEIFPSGCGSSTPAPSCQDERRQQTSCAAAAGRVAWRARGSCTTARLHSNASMALTPALAHLCTIRSELCGRPRTCCGHGRFSDGGSTEEGGVHERCSEPREDTRMTSLGEPRVSDRQGNLRTG